MAAEMPAAHGAPAPERGLGGVVRPHEPAPVVAEDALDKVLTEHRVIEAPVFFDREGRKGRHQGLGEEPHAACGELHLAAVDWQPRHAARGRAPLEDKAVEVRLFQLTELSRREGLHGVSEVFAG